MTSFALLPTQWRVFVIFFLLVDTLLFLFIIIYRCFSEMKRTGIIIDILFFLFGIMLVAVFKAQHEAVCAGIQKPVPEIPFFWLAILGAAGNVYALVRMDRLRKRCNTAISKGSIRESIDNLPSGIGFFDENGFPCMINRQMYLLCDFLLGRDVQSADELRTALKYPADGTVVLDPEAGLYRLPDGRVWRFTESVIITEEGEKFIRFLAADVQELYEGQKKLENDNIKLREVSESMKELSRNILAVTNEEEILSMKMRVHDDLGHSVLATQQLLVRGYTEEDARLILEQWKNVLNLLRCDNEATVSYGWMDLLEERAAILGLKLCYQGTFPVDERCAKLLAAAVQECITNSVRHGRATELNINIEENAKQVFASITNNGITSNAEIVEGGGLSGLRSKVEANGGSMTVSSFPIFSLTVVIPKKEDVL